MPTPSFLVLPPTHGRTFGLDLLRAFAIVTVLLAHGAVYVSPKFSFFYLYVVRFDGVSIFFVLSGFLIGGILIRTLESRPVTFTTLWDFWIKRWIRTVPPYFLALLIAIGLGASGPNISFRAFLPFFFFVQNLNWPHPYLYMEGWSLAVEEWFYLLSAPSIFLLTAAKFKPKTSVLIAALSVIVLTTAHRYHAFSVSPPLSSSAWEELYRKIVFQRLDALMYGVLGAWWAYYYTLSWFQYKKTKFVLGLVCLYLLGDTYFVYAHMLQLFGCVFSFACAALATTLMLPMLNSWKTSTGFGARVVTHISLISYSMYLLHSSIINNTLVLPFIHFLPVSQAVAAVIGMSLFWGLTLLFSTLMYKYVETPIMKLRNKLKSNHPVKAVA